jgi:tRNA (guanosine-2'-O-)-methyltransferase
MQAELESYYARVTPRRVELLTKVAQNRTRQFCMVLEDLFDPHNISAVVLTSEVYGLQDVYVIEEDNPYRVNKSILKGSLKWMNLALYKKRTECLEALRAKGYRIAVASTNTTNSVLDLDLSIPTAFYLGSEFRGNHPDTLRSRSSTEFVVFVLATAMRYPLARSASRHSVRFLYRARFIHLREPLRMDLFTR